MKKIIDVATKEEVMFTEEHLPLLVHGKDKSGASLFSITLAANLAREGKQLSIYTAYPMAKEEFIAQVGKGNENFSWIEEKDFEKAFSEDAIVFIKNIETIKDSKIISFLQSSNRYIISGDLEQSSFSKDLIALPFKTKILFSTLAEAPLPLLEKYQASMQNSNGEKIVTLQ